MKATLFIFGLLAALFAGVAVLLKFGEGGALVVFAIVVGVFILGLALGSLLLTGKRLSVRFLC